MGPQLQLYDDFIIDSMQFTRVAKMPHFVTYRPLDMPKRSKENPVVNPDISEDL